MKNLDSNSNPSMKDCAANAAATTVANIIKSFDYKDWDDIEALEVINVFLTNNFGHSITDVLIGEDRCG